MPTNQRDKQRTLVVLAILAVLAWTLWLWLCLSPQGIRGPIPLLERHFSLPGTQSAEATLDSRAKLGDAFGPFNALVSTIALGILLVTLNLQRKQLDQQNEQLSLQKDQASAEFELIRQQQFQEQFFRAVDGYQQQLSALSARYDQADSKGDYGGRNALNFIVDSELRSAMLRSAEIGPCIAEQIRPGSDIVSWHQRLSEKVATVRAELERFPDRRSAVLASLGNAWAAVYFRHRFQLDALFRAWYTVYRVLDTAPSYRIDEQKAWLYGASFRAQLSWIELLVLLLNQSAFDSDSRHPTACRYSNKYCVFDNLSAESDIIVMVLHDAAAGVPASTDGLTLNNAAFVRAKGASKQKPDAADSAVVLAANTG